MNTSSDRYSDNYAKIFGTSNKKTLRKEVDTTAAAAQADLPVPAMLLHRKKADLDSMQAQKDRLIKGIKGDMEALNAKVEALDALVEGMVQEGHSSEERA